MLHLTWALISEMLTLNSQGNFNKGSIIQSEVKFTEKTRLSRITESLEVTSAHALYCAGGSDDTKWSGLISDLANNDYSNLNFKTDDADETWLPVTYVPLGCVINNNIGEAYRSKSGTSNSQLRRFIGQYWTVETQPQVGITRSIPHEPVLTLATHVHVVVFGQNYMRDGSYIHARINQLEPAGKTITNKNIKVASNLVEEIRSTTSMRSPNVISSNPRRVQEPGSVGDGLQHAWVSPPQALRRYQTEGGTELNSGTRVSHSPGISAENDSQSHPGSVRRILTEVEGFTRATTDSTNVQHQPVTQIITKGDAEENITVYGRFAATVFKKMNKGTPENRALMAQYRNPWNKSGIGQGTEHTRRSLNETTDGTRQYFFENLGQRPQNVTWGNNIKRSVAGDGWASNNQLAQVRAESARAVNIGMSYQTREAFYIPRVITEVQPATTREDWGVKVITLVISGAHGVVHSGNHVRARPMDNNDVLRGFSGVGMSFFGPVAEIEKLTEWFEQEVDTDPLVECHTEDWPGSTPTPILEYGDNNFNQHATEEVLFIGYGLHTCTRFRHTYLTRNIRDDCFAKGSYAENVQEACLTVLDTLRKVLTNAEIPISLLELMRVGPKFMIIDMATSALCEDSRGQATRSAKLDAWIRAACNTSSEWMGSDFTVKQGVYPDKETPLEGYEQSNTAQYNMELSALFEFRTTRKDDTGLAVGRSGELIATMFATEIAQGLASKMYELMNNFGRKKQYHGPAHQKSKSTRSNKMQTVIRGTIKAAAQQLTDEEHISVSDTDLIKQREEFKEAVIQHRLEDHLKYEDIQAYAYDATIHMLKNHGSQDIQLGGLHFMCIAHVLSPRQWLEAEALTAGVHEAILHTRRRVAMIRVSPLITGDDNTLLLADGESIDVELAKGFIMYLRSWDMIVNNTQRDTHTKSTLQQIIDTGITGEKCTETYRPAPHIKRWNCKVQGSLGTVVQLASELFLDADEHGVGTNDAQQQTNGTVSSILANDIGAGTVTECDKACTSVGAPHGQGSRRGSTTRAVIARQFRNRTNKQVRQFTIRVRSSEVKKRVGKTGQNNKSTR